MKGFVQVKKAVAKKVNGVWVPTEDFTEVYSGSNDMTMYATGSWNGYYSEFTEALPTASAGVSGAGGSILLKPMHKGASPLSYGLNATSSTRNELIIPMSSRISWNVLTDNGIDPPFYLFHFRVDPDANPRTVWGARLFYTSVSQNATTYDGKATACSLPFNTGCAQATNELLDILYRIEASEVGVYNNAPTGSSAMYNALLNPTGIPQEGYPK